MQLEPTGCGIASREAHFRSWNAVLDSKKGLRKNRRTDFGRMKPKWLIAVMAK